MLFKLEFVETFQTNMRKLAPHQVNALEYSIKVTHPSLFMEMRLGKTLVVKRRVDLYNPRAEKILVIAPLTVLGTWIRELSLENETDVVKIVGTKHARMKLLSENHRWNLINKEGLLVIPEIGNWMWDVVVIDESVCIKNPKAKITKYCLSHFRNTKHRWILSGLPHPESDLDLFCQLAFLDGHAFGYRTYWDFRAKCYKPKPWGYEWEPLPGVPSLVRRTLLERTFMLRRQDVNLENRRVYERRELTLPDGMKRVYKVAEEEFVLENENMQEIDSTVSALGKYTWLRYIANGFVDGDMVWDGKAKELLDIHELLAGDSYVVWFTFNCDLSYIDQLYTKLHITHGVVTGEIDPSERDTIFKDFNERKIQVLLIQIAVGQYGLDLSQADTAIFYSNNASLTQRRQAEDRICNPFKGSPLLYIDLVTTGTVDEDILEAIDDKLCNVTATFNAVLRSRMKARALEGKQRG